MLLSACRRWDYSTVWNMSCLVADMCHSLLVVYIETECSSLSMFIVCGMAAIASSQFPSMAGQWSLEDLLTKAKPEVKCD